MDQPGENVVISNPVLIDGNLTPLTLHADGWLRWFERGDEKWMNVEKEVVGVSMEGSRITLRRAVESGGRYLCVTTTGSLVTKNFVFEPCSEISPKLWYQKLREYLDSLGRPKRLFIFVNPFGGKKSALKIFVNVVKPLLDAAGIQYTVQETKCQLHAKEVASGLDLTQYDGIVCVSGDGILVEVINGLLCREDWDTAIKMPIGIVPAGTGNGMAKSLLDSVGDPCSASNAVLAIIRGHKQPLDVATISQGKTRFFSVLMLAWGLVADIDIESEKFRWMGSARLDFYAIQRMLHLRKYHGRIHFVPAPGFQAYVDRISQESKPIWEVQSVNPSEEEPRFQEHGYQGPNVDIENMNWRTMEGPFISVWLHNVPWGGETAKPAPDAKFSDGFLDLIVVRDCPKLALLALMTSLSNGGHIKSPHVSYFKVKSFILEAGPRTEDPTKEGIIDCDGEVLARGTGTYMSEQKSLMAYDRLQINVHEGLATLFSPI
ncbi:hypothetical protein Nepgr_007233 [Nepenthes gracilis]|uniref:sphingosine kinase n=1 Tax=Nepenthes gracilis TaxID=150966 RepID=A0AAD3S6N3_NEPGR|nr:hypothetical protein Nepgr_007233 [Nepenthes gracilis]